MAATTPPGPDYVKTRVASILAGGDTPTATADDPPSVKESPRETLEQPAAAPVPPATGKDGKFTCEEVARAALGEPAKQAGAELYYHAPWRKDQRPSLSINTKKDVWGDFPAGLSGNAWELAARFAGCEPAKKKAVTAWLKDKGLLNGNNKRKANGRGPTVAEFIHTDAEGNPVFKKVRHEPGEGGKAKDYVEWHFADGKWNPGRGNAVPPLYRLPKIKNESLIFLFESHTDVERAVSVGLPATTSGGSNSWRDEYADDLAGNDVCLVPDNNAAGAKYAATVCASLHAKVRSLKVVPIEPYPDFRRWADAGGTREKLIELYKAAPEFRPATGAEILDAIMRFIRRFVCLTEAQARVVALWVVHTHCLEAADSTPYLDINSAEKQSGKTRLLEILRLLVFAAWFTGRVSAAVLVRKIDAKEPTLLLDESDAAFSGEKEYAEALRGTLNNGYRRGGCASLCIGKGAEIGFKDFSVFCPKAIAGIGKKPDTVTDRSNPIRLKRAERGTVERFRERDAEREAEPIRAKVAAWSAANIETLKQSRPKIPPQLSDRQADVNEPLLAIAEFAGDEWAQAARAALVKLCAGAQAADESTGVQLLRDIKGILCPRDKDGNETSEIKEMPSATLAESLAKIETSPWGEWSKGKPLSPTKLAHLLKPFEVYPGQIDKGKARGYRLEHFQEAFSLYLPPESVKVSDDRENSGDDGNFEVSNETPSDTLKNAVSPNNHAGLRHFDTLKPGTQGTGAKKQAGQGNMGSRTATAGGGKQGEDAPHSGCPPTDDEVI